MESNFRLNKDNLKRLFDEKKVKIFQGFTPLKEPEINYDEQDCVISLQLSYNYTNMSMMLPVVSVKDYSVAKQYNIYFQSLNLRDVIDVISINEGLSVEQMAMFFNELVLISDHTTMPTILDNTIRSGMCRFNCERKQGKVSYKVRGTLAGDKEFETLRELIEHNHNAYHQHFNTVDLKQRTDRIR